jgi:hypothetical protein
MPAERGWVGGGVCVWGVGGVGGSICQFGAAMCSAPFGLLSVPFCLPWLVMGSMACVHGGGGEQQCKNINLVMHTGGRGKGAAVQLWHGLAKNKQGTVGV